MGEARRDALRVGFDRAIKLEFHGAKVSSDAGLFPYRDLDEAAQLTDSGPAELFDFRTGTNVHHGTTALLRQSVYSRLAGYQDVNPGAPGLRDKLIKIGAKVIHHARYVTFQLAEVAVPRRLYRAILERIRRFAALSPRAAPI